MSYNPIEPTGLALDIKTNYLKRLEAFAKGAKFIIHHRFKLSKAETVNDSKEETGEALADWEAFDESTYPNRQKLKAIDDIYVKFESDLERIESEIKNNNPENPQEAINQFYRDAASKKKIVNSLLSFVLELKEICDGNKISLAESWVAWLETESQLFKGKELIVEALQSQGEEQASSVTSATIQQTEEFLDIPLTTAQIKNIKLIIAKPPPKWFQELPEWAQNALKEEFFTQELQGSQIVMVFNSEKYQRYKPPTLRNVPGIVNTAKHTLTVTVNDQTISTESYRQGVPIPYDMPSTEKLPHTIENFRQLLNYHDERIKEFKNLYSDAKDYGSAITHISLLSGGWKDSFKMWAIDRLHSDSDNNTEFLNLTHDALAKIASTDISSYNFPVNSERPFWPKIIDEQFIEQMRNRKEKMPESPKKDVLIKVIASMEHYNKNCCRESGRNPNLFAAGLMMAAVRLSGGVAISNCKSGKDREAAAILMADSIITYSLIHSEAPQFNDKGEQREKFLEIQEKLYRDGAHQAVADRGSPGSAGIKDEGFIEKDFIERQEVHDAYKVSKTIADNNKPEQKFYKMIYKDKLLLAESIISVIALGLGIGLAASGFGLMIVLPLIISAVVLFIHVCREVNRPPMPLAPPSSDSREGIELTGFSYLRNI